MEQKQATVYECVASEIKAAFMWAIVGWSVKLFNLIQLYLYGAYYNGIFSCRFTARSILEQHGQGKTPLW